MNPLPEVEVVPEESTVRTTPGIGGPIKESLIIDDGFVNVYSEPLKAVLTKDDLDEVAQRCNEKT